MRWCNLSDDMGCRLSLLWQARKPLGIAECDENIGREFSDLKPGIEECRFQFDTLAQQFSASFVVSSKARADQLTSKRVVEPNPPSLSS